MSGTDSLEAPAETTGPNADTVDSRLFRGDSKEVVDVDAAVDHLERVERGEVRHKGMLPTGKLPGFSDSTAHDDCGDDLPRFCECCGDTKTFGATCYESMCRRCAQSWNLRQGARSAAKVEAMRRYRNSFLPETQFAHHLVLSPPDEWNDVVADDSLRRTVEAIKDVMGEFGVEGMWAFHPYRGDDEHRDGPDDRGEWPDRIYADRDWDDVQDELEYSPHFHLIVVGSNVAGGRITRELESRTGWLMKRITKGENSTVSIYNEHDLSAVTSYVLSHTLIRPDSNGDMSACYDYFGPNANRATADDELKDEFDAVTREVAPRVLGLEYRTVACLEERTPGGGWGSARTVSTSEAAGTMEFTGSASSGSDDDSEEASEKVEKVEETEPVRCSGRMLSLSRAPEFLEKDDWTQEARHADDLAREWERWKHRADWTTHG